MERQISGASLGSKLIWHASPPNLQLWLWAQSDRPTCTHLSNCSSDMPRGNRTSTKKDWHRQSNLPSLQLLVVPVMNVYPSCSFPTLPYHNALFRPFPLLSLRLYPTSQPPSSLQPHLLPLAIRNTLTLHIYHTNNQSICTRCQLTDVSATARSSEYGGICRRLNPTWPDRSGSTPPRQSKGSVYRQRAKTTTRL